MSIQSAVMPSPSISIIPNKAIAGGVASQLMSGDEAVAAAALDAGVRFASSYPGTPATDILESLIRYSDPKKVRCVWSINEKVAYESALAVAIAGQRSFVSMKQVGLNVAADAFMNSCPGGTNAGLVLVVGDDPECHSSQNKQDTRHYRAMSGALLLEPSDAQEAYSMTREAFLVSERFLLPIIIRLTSRTAYGCTPVQRKPADAGAATFNWPREPQRFFIVPTVSRRLFLRISKLQCEMAQWIAESAFSYRKDASRRCGKRFGILCTGIGSALSCEYLPANAGMLKVGGEPFPDDEIGSFVNAHDEILVLEEGDALLEQRARALARQGVIVRGRISGDLKPVGELQVSEIVAAISGENATNSPPPPDLPARLPEICKPCGYHKVFGALKQLSNIATPSDIGCNSLGGLPPYSVMDGVWAMGSSIGVACGLAAIGHPRIVAIIGDSTFFHAGIPPTIEAVHEAYALTILLLDNGTAAMTGGQGVAHRSSGNPIQNGIDMIRLIGSLGVARCTPFDPHKLGQDGIRDLVEQSFSEPGVKVLLYRSQCGVYSPGYFTESNPNKTRLEREE